MTDFQLEKYLCDLISIKSISGDESAVLNFVFNSLVSLGFQVEKIAVTEDRYNIYAKLGEPNICFSTHLDVVPAPEFLFTPQIENERIIGRGACDAKGMVASQIGAAVALKARGRSNFSLLFVVGEEEDGIGAKVSSKYFQEKTFRYLINGEPTNCNLMTAHKGGVTFNICTKGKTAHSGYPERGEDANQKLLSIAFDLLNADFGTDLDLGASTLNLGKIEAGVASNVISDRAVLKGMVRTVSDNQKVISKLHEIVGNKGELEIIGDAPKVRLKTIPGFNTEVASYCTDIPFLLPISQEFLLYGPGSIFEAHTDHEFIEVKQLHQAVKDYQRLYEELM